MRMFRLIGAVVAALSAAPALGQALRVEPADIFQWNVVGNNITVSAGSVTASYSLLLPPAQATASGQTLVNNGAGILSWANPAAAITGTAPIVVTPTASGANISITTPIPTSAGGTGVASAGAVYLTTTGVQTAQNKTLVSPVITSGETLNGSTTGSVTLQAPASGATWTMTFPTTAGVTGQVLYDTGSGNTTWASLGFIAGYMVNGSRATPNSVTATGGITILGQQRELQFIQGSPGAVTVTASPAIQAGTVVGQELVLAGGSSTNTVTLTNGTGLDINGSIVLGANGAGSKIYLVWDGTNWSEVARR